MHQATDVGPILKDSLAKTQKVMKQIKFKKSSNEQVWNPITHLGVDLKTLLRSDSKMKVVRTIRESYDATRSVRNSVTTNTSHSSRPCPRPLTSATRRSLGESTSPSPGATTARTARTSDPWMWLPVSTSDAMPPAWPTNCSRRSKAW